MNRLLFSAAVGAAAMYFLDPQAGRRRRVRTRDKAERVARRVRNAYDVTLRDTEHRAAVLTHHLFEGGLVAGAQPLDEPSVVPR